MVPFIFDDFHLCRSRVIELDMTANRMKKRAEITDISKDLSYAVVFNLLPDFLNHG
jgi:hypothetical protein